MKTHVSFDHSLGHAPADEGSARFQNRAVATSFLKGLDLMTILARRPEGLPMSILMRKLNLPRTSVLRMLTTLEQYGLVMKNDRTWCATAHFYDWSSRDTHSELKHRYLPVVRAVAAEVDELVELAIGEARGVAFIIWEQGSQPIAIDPLKSAMFPLHRTAAGKLLLSQRPDLAAEVSDPRLQAEIQEAQVNGYAWNRRESDPNIMAIATWVSKPSSITPVICIKWPFFRFSEARAMQALTVVRRELAKLDAQQPCGARQFPVPVQPARFPVPRAC